MKGVYIIKNLYNSMVYIGSASSIENRIRDHFAMLRRGEHYNYGMQKDYTKYSKFFIWDIYCQVDAWLSRDQVYNMEQSLLDMTPNRYNILLNAKDHLLDDLTKRETSRQMKLNL